MYFGAGAHGIPWGGSMGSQGGPFGTHWPLGPIGPWGPLGLGDPLALGDPWALGTLGLGDPWALGAGALGPVYGDRTGFQFVQSNKRESATL